ncbi:MAG: hypothetical protein M3139_06320 [Bacteroidota bacterium]|nr:hypothetical protein [Bacteroidota bacterium]
MQESIWFASSNVRSWLWVRSEYGRCVVASFENGYQITLFNILVRVVLTFLLIYLKNITYWMARPDDNRISLIGIIASIKAPEIFFKSFVLAAPSPFYINDVDYIGSFIKFEIEELLELLDNNHLGWSMSMAPVLWVTFKSGN